MAGMSLKRLGRTSAPQDSNLRPLLKAALVHLSTGAASFARQVANSHFRRRRHHPAAGETAAAEALPPDAEGGVDTIVPAVCTVKSFIDDESPSGKGARRRTTQPHRGERVRGHRSAGTCLVTPKTMA